MLRDSLISLFNMRIVNSLERHFFNHALFEILKITVFWTAPAAMLVFLCLLNPFCEYIRALTQQHSLLFGRILILPCQTWICLDSCLFYETCIKSLLKGNVFICVLGLRTFAYIHVTKIITLLKDVVNWICLA